VRDEEKSFMRLSSDEQIEAVRHLSKFKFSLSAYGAKLKAHLHCGENLDKLGRLKEQKKYFAYLKHSLLARFLP
jgi:hypothetical protein